MEGQRRHTAQKHCGPDPSGDVSPVNLTGEMGGLFGETNKWLKKKNQPLRVNSGWREEEIGQGSSGRCEALWELSRRELPGSWRHF